MEQLDLVFGSIQLAFLTGGACGIVLCVLVQVLCGIAVGAHKEKSEKKLASYKDFYHNSENIHTDL